jgi:hypothetical protein
MLRQTEVVFRREIDDRSVVDARVGFLFTLEDTKMAVEALGLQRLEFVGEVAERIGAQAPILFQKNRIKTHGRMAALT